MQPAEASESAPLSNRPNYLTEIPEAKASGEIRELYDDIRRVSGLPLVNLIYRHLAAEGQLAEVWAQLRPNLVDPAVDSFAAQLPPPSNSRVIRIPTYSLKACGIGEVTLRQTIATLDVYRRANCRNLLALTGLLAGCRGTERDDGEVVEARDYAAPSLLPMIALESAAIPLQRLLSEASDQITDVKFGLVPSLLRHLASNPPLFALTWVAIQPALPDSLSTVPTLRRRALRLAKRLPRAIQRLSDPQTRALFAGFEAMIPTMIVVGGLISDSLECVRGDGVTGVDV